MTEKGLTCPKCSSDWIYDKEITMIIKKNTSVNKPKGKRYRCINCKTEWD